MQADRDDFEARRAERAARRSQRSGGTGRDASAGRAGSGYAPSARPMSTSTLGRAGTASPSARGASRPVRGSEQVARAQGAAAGARGGYDRGYDAGRNSRGTPGAAGSAATAVLGLVWGAVRLVARGVAALLKLLWRGLCALVRVLVPACRNHPRVVVALVAAVAVAIAGVNVRSNVLQGRQEASEAAALAGAQQQAQALASAAVDQATGLVEPTSTPKSQWKRGEMPYLYQIDPQWSHETYSGGRLRHQGCGPTALTMVYVCLTGNTDYDPARMCEFATEQGYSTNQNGTSWSLMTSGAATLGLESTQISVTESRIKAELEAGRPVICIMNPGHFTSSGHFIAIEGLDADGKAKVHDSNSVVRSQKTWDLSVICSEAASAWSFSVE